MTFFSDWPPFKENLRYYAGFACLTTVLFSSALYLREKNDCAERRSMPVHLMLYKAEPHQPKNFGVTDKRPLLYDNKYQMVIAKTHDDTVFAAQAEAALGTFRDNGTLDVFHYDDETSTWDSEPEILHYTMQ